MGITLAAEIDTESLPTQQGKKIVEMVEMCEFFDFPSELRAPAGGADCFEYEITVAENKRNHTVTVHDAAIPPSLQLLLDVLARIARSQSRQS